MPAAALSQSVCNFQIVCRIHAASVIFVLRRISIQRIHIWIGVEQHTVVLPAEVFDDPGASTCCPNADVVPNLHVCVPR